MIETINFEALRAIGLGDTQRRQLELGVAHPGWRPMRVIEVQRNELRLHDGRAERRAVCLPSLARELAADDDALAVGDWVLACADGAPGDAGRASVDDVDGMAGASRCTITCRLPPHGRITRRTSEGGRNRDQRGTAQRQVLVSNVDTALLVMGLDHDFQLRRLERYLALARLSGVAAVLVLSKADTVAPALAAQRLAQVAELLPQRMPAWALDMRCDQAASALAPWLLPGQTLALLGSSGAGKSTLANTLVRVYGAAALGGGAQATGAVRADDSRGRHTTTARTLLPLPGGACLIDTPGLRALRLDVDDGEQLADAFGDVARYAPLCRFRDCRHQQEPGCAVRDAVPEPRLRNFQKLLREAGRDSQTVLERRAQLAQWKARGRAGQARARAKRHGHPGGEGVD
jgi:ribosome biogenesis GTPase / thiamine phosphate phosphatase